MGTMTSFTMTSLWMTLLSGMTSGHVFLYDPPQRSSIWRHKGMDKTGLVETNTDDMGLNCGGTATQYEKNGGRCGVCGDPYDPRPRPHYPHQFPGRFARGVIAGCYTAGARTMEAEVWITAHHKGYFEFRLCPNNDYTRHVTQSCLDKHLLQVESSQGEIIGTRYYPDVETMAKEGHYKVELVLPSGLVCTQCVLQFLYNAGNSWGCEGKQCGIGHGNQEQFWNCADIAILPNCQGVVGHRAPGSPPMTELEQEHLYGDHSHNHGNQQQHKHGNQNHIHGNEQHINVHQHQIHDNIHGNEQLNHGNTPQNHGNQGHPRGASSLFSFLLQERENGMARHREASGKSRSNSATTSDTDEEDETEKTQADSDDTSPTVPVLVTSQEQNHVVLSAPVSGVRSVSPSRSQSGHRGSINHRQHPSRSPLRGSIRTAETHSQSVNRDSSVESETHHRDASTCRAAGAWKGDHSIDDWCRVNCGQGNCPSSHCVC